MRRGVLHSCPGFLHRVQNIAILETMFGATAGLSTHNLTTAGNFFRVPSLLKPRSPSAIRQDLQRCGLLSMISNSAAKNSCVYNNSSAFISHSSKHCTMLLISRPPRIISPLAAQVCRRARKHIYWPAEQNRCKSPLAEKVSRSCSKRN